MSPFVSSTRKHPATWNQPTNNRISFGNSPIKLLNANASILKASAKKLLAAMSLQSPLVVMERIFIPCLAMEFSPKLEMPNLYLASELFLCQQEGYPTFSMSPSFDNIEEEGYPGKEEEEADGANEANIETFFATTPVLCALGF